MQLENDYYKNINNVKLNNVHYKNNTMHKEKKNNYKKMKNAILACDNNGKYVFNFDDTLLKILIDNVELTIIKINNSIYKCYNNYYELYAYYEINEFNFCILYNKDSCVLNLWYELATD